MAYRRVLCLAFSRREGGKCFAGIDLGSGRWVRPVNSPSVGALYDHQCFAQTQAGQLSDPRVLDILEIDLSVPSPKPCQPENWLIGKESWRLVGRCKVSDLSAHIVCDPELIRGYDRFVSAEEIEARPPQNSLVVVAPENLKWFVEKDRYGRRRLRGRFSICGASYDLPLTDHAYEKELRDVTLFTSRNHDTSVPILLTISLSDVLKETGRHYKLIAGVIF